MRTHPAILLRELTSIATFVRRGTRRRGSMFALAVSRPALVVLLGLLALIPLRPFVTKFVHSDFLALALSVPDDSFYYLLPAWHFSAHGYFTFDGVHKTYGFQPLYMLLLTGLSMILPSIEAVFRAGLCVNATLHAATGVMVGLAVNATLPTVAGALRQGASLLAGSVYLLGYNLYAANVTLMENPLAAFLYVLSILCLLRALSRRTGRAVLADMGIGTLLGCLILARLLPSSLLAVGVMLVVAGVCLSRRSTLVIVASMLIPLAIWGIYAKISFGHILPTSLLVKNEGLLAVIRYWLALAPAEVYRSLAEYASNIVHFLADRGNRLGFLREAFLALGVAALGVCVVFPSWWSRSRTLMVALAAVSLGGLFAIPILLYSRQSELLYTKWYYFDISAIFAIVCGVALGFLGHMVVGWLAGCGVGPQPAPAAACIGLLCLAAAAAEVLVFREVRPLASWEYSASDWQHVMARTTLWFRSEMRLDESEPVGALNAGIVGLLLGGKVINLDGLANDDVVHHLGRGGTLAEYVSRKRIRYVIDILPPDWWENLGITAIAIRTEEFRNPNYPFYYVLRLH